MRKVVAALHTTFDGIMSGPAGDEDNMVSWGMPGITDSTPDFQSSFQEFDTILLGRVTYEGLSQFWPFQSGEFADLMNHTPKIVFSRTLSKVEWGTFDNISLINKNVEREVKKLKEQNGKDMIMFASSRLIQSFTNAGLIDEYRIVLHPIILGSGKRLFDNIQARHDLKLESVKPYNSGAILLRYGVASQ
jgi:dihydrofolate reductase